MLHCEEVPVPELRDLSVIPTGNDGIPKEVESSASDSGGSVCLSS